MTLWQRIKVMFTGLSNDDSHAYIQMELNVLTDEINKSIQNIRDLSSKIDLESRTASVLQSKLDLSVNKEDTEVIFTLGNISLCVIPSISSTGSLAFTLGVKEIDSKPFIEFQSSKFRMLQPEAYHKLNSELATRVKDAIQQSIDEDNFMKVLQEIDKDYN